MAKSVLSFLATKGFQAKYLSGAMAEAAILASAQLGTSQRRYRRYYSYLSRQVNHAANDHVGQRHRQ